MPKKPTPTPTNAVKAAKPPCRNAAPATPKQSAAPRAPVGRPSLYRPEHVETVHRLGLLGLTDEEIAKFFGVDVTTVYNWDKAHPEFYQSRTRARDDADAQVAERLFKRALGYSHPAVKIFMPAGAEAPVYADYTEHYPPDTQAATWWLKNRQKALWQDKSAVENSGTVQMGVIAVPAKTA